MFIFLSPFYLSSGNKTAGQRVIELEYFTQQNKGFADLLSKISPLKVKMRMMKIIVKSLHFTADSKLIEYVEKKLSRLTRYFDRAVDAEVHLKVQDTGSKVQDKITEIKIHVPGGWLMDKKTGKTFEEAVDESVDTLKRQLLRHKEKINSHHHGRRLEE